MNKTFSNTGKELVENGAWYQLGRDPEKWAAFKPQRIPIAPNVTIREGNALVEGVDFKIGKTVINLANRNFPAVNDYKEFAYPISKQEEGKEVDADFTLWVVVNRWQYDSYGHKWFNTYIGEFETMRLTHLEIYKLYLASKPTTNGF